MESTTTARETSSQLWDLSPPTTGWTWCSSDLSEYLTRARQRNERLHDLDLGDSHRSHSLHCVRSKQDSLLGAVQTPLPTRRRSLSLPVPPFLRFPAGSGPATLSK